MEILVFDISGSLAHFKKYYATTSALSYSIPPKTSLYGLIGAILGLSKADNAYLQHFQDKSCLIGLKLLRAPASQRIGINLRPDRGRYKENPKPTIHEFVREPHYRIFFYHRDAEIQRQLEKALISHTCVFTPSMGLANLLCNFEWVGKCNAERQSTPQPVWVDSVLPMSQFLSFGEMNDAEIAEQTMFAIEMNTERIVTERDDILFERRGAPVNVVLTHYFSTEKHGNIALF